ncbi:hypothetical protein DEA8626_00683 [Defluviimonas aquaemixtae]|uniref:Uncharacterized protein n=1 Tax=Albidovulum aquaemixtae TaxID=1542388 RepID=A0A2R8B3K0_9RHOB|nr:hypothetical protein [Defluviimonas aquaemixtae]SPH17167.1 hypothetical protein DEA8626_00683 [Defluviimonas aquaemixtae]
MDRLYVMTGFVWLIFGMVFGIYLGITDQLQFSNSHAHANLLGFVISVLFGLIYRGWPVLLSHRLAMPQFALYQVGAVVLVAAKYDIDNGGAGRLAAPGSMIVVLGTLLMFWMFARIRSEKPVAGHGILS